MRVWHRALGAHLHTRGASIHDYDGVGVLESTDSVRERLEDGGIAMVKQRAFIYHSYTSPFLQRPCTLHRWNAEQSNKIQGDFVKDARRKEEELKSRSRRIREARSKRT